MLIPRWNLPSGTHNIVQSTIIQQGIKYFLRVYHMHCGSCYLYVSHVILSTIPRNRYNFPDSQMKKQAEKIQVTQPIIGGKACIQR